MALTRWMAIAALAALLPANAAQAELYLQVTFTEKQTRSRGLGRGNDTCRTEYAIKTLGTLLFIETIKSNCRTFRVGDIQGADGSAAAIVFEGRSSSQRKTCTYVAKSRTETCSDRTRVRVPDGPEVDYKARIDTRARYQLGKSGLTATRQIVRMATTPDGYQERTDAGLKISVAIQGNACQLTEFVSTSKSEVVNPGRGRAIKGATLRESRQLVKAESCKLISR